MNILIATRYLPPVIYGISSYSYFLSKKFLEMGLNTHVAYYDILPKKSLNVYSGVKLHYASLLKMGYSIEKIERFISKTIVKYKIDIVDFQFSEHFPYEYIPILLAKERTKVPLVITAHSPLEDGILGKLQRQVFDKADKIIVCAKWMKRLFSEYGYEVVVENVGIDVDFFKPMNVKKVNNSILYVGSLRSKMGIPNLIRSIGIVKKEFKNVKLTMAGPDADHMKYVFDKSVKKMGLEKNIQYLGVINDYKKLIKVYNQNEIFVFPSFWEFWGPHSLLEAMSCGLPCISTSTQGGVELIENGVNGRLIDLTCSEKDLAKTIFDLLKDPKERERIGKNAREKILKDNNIKKIADNLINIFKEII